MGTRGGFGFLVSGDWDRPIENRASYGELRAISELRFRITMRRGGHRARFLRVCGAEYISALGRGALRGMCDIGIALSYYSGALWTSGACDAEYISALGRKKIESSYKLARNPILSTTSYD